MTAGLPGDVFAFLNKLRQAHFPPERNHLSAHLTLFHAIPPSCERELRGLMADLSREYAPPMARLDGLLNLGRGTAFRVLSDTMLEVRALIADRFAGVLTAQDTQQPRLHVTIQNKVAPREAKHLQQVLEPDMEPRDFAIPALEAHYYIGPQWEAAGRWPFRGSARR